MRVLAMYDPKATPPMLRMFIHGAPHRRQHRAVHQKYREELVMACKAADIDIPINHPIDLWVMFIDPCSPDIGNLYLALEAAMDAKSLKGPSILADDSVVYGLSCFKYYPHGEPVR